MGRVINEAGKEQLGMGSLLERIGKSKLSGFVFLNT